MRKRLGALLAVAALAVSACGSSDSESASSSGSSGSSGTEPYRIVQLLGQNQAGPAALNAQAAAQGAKAAVAVLNAEGGILGHPVELEIIDDNGDPTIAVTKLQERLSSGTTPNLVLPGNTSAEALPMAPIITEAEIFSVQQASASALDNPTEFPFLFKVPPVPASWAQGLVEYAKTNNVTKIAMIAGKDAFAQATAEATRTAISDAGLTLTGDETYTAEDLDMTAQLERLRATDPELVFMQGAGAAVGYVLDSRVKIGWTDVPLVADSTSAVTSLLNQEPPNGLVGTPATENVFVQVLAGAITGADGANPGAVDKMVTALKAEGEIKLPLNSYFIYDAIMLAAKAAQATDTITDAKAQSAWLEKLTPTESGLWALTKYSFTAESHGPAVDATSTTIIAAAALTDGRYPAAS